MRGIDKGTVFFLTAESEGLVILGGPPRGRLLNLSKPCTVGHKILGNCQPTPPLAQHFALIEKIINVGLRKGWLGSFTRYHHVIIILIHMDQYGFCRSSLS